MSVSLSVEIILLGVSQPLGQISSSTCTSQRATPSRNPLPEERVHFTLVMRRDRDFFILYRFCVPCPTLWIYLPDLLQGFCKGSVQIAASSQISSSFQSFIFAIELAIDYCWKCNFIHLLDIPLFLYQWQLAKGTVVYALVLSIFSQKFLLGIM